MDSCCISQIDFYFYIHLTKKKKKKTFIDNKNPLIATSLSLSRLLARDQTHMLETLFNANQKLKTELELAYQLGSGIKTKEPGTKLS